jgi:hypothetical protein
LPELAHELVPAPGGPGDPALAAVASRRVRELLAAEVVDDTGHSRTLESKDLAVITPHVEQASAAAARLADVPGVLIDTATQA